jgi:hypothetical protein
MGLKAEFLCPKMMNSDRLWWIGHASSQEIPQTSAACVWPCETKSKCSSPGGTIIENKLNGQYFESNDEARRVWDSSNCVDETKISDMFKIEENEMNCANAAEGDFYPSKYCNVFHRCVNGKQKDFECPKASTKSSYNLWWNDKEKRCVWPCEIECNKEIYSKGDDSPKKNSTQIQIEDRQLNGGDFKQCLQTVNDKYIQQQKELYKHYKPQYRPPQQQQFQYKQPPLYQYQQQRQKDSPIIEKKMTLPPQQPLSTLFYRSNNKQPIFYTTTPPVSWNKFLSFEEINKPFPDDDFFCSQPGGSGLMGSKKYCNVYYDCKEMGQPAAAYYCENGYFDDISKFCKPTSQVRCHFNPPLMYPFIQVNIKNKVILSYYNSKILFSVVYSAILLKI